MLLVDEPRVLTVGTFDLLHDGHYNLINNMIKKFGEKNVYIALSSDNWNILKGKETFYNYQHRSENLKKIFNKINIIEEDSSKPFSAIPEILIKYSITTIYLGQWQKSLEKIIDKLNMNIKFITQKRLEGISSTILKNKLINSAEEFGINGMFYRKIINFEKGFFIKDLKIEIINEGKKSSIYKIDKLIYKRFNDSRLKQKEIDYRKILGLKFTETPLGIIYEFIEGHNICLLNIENNETVINNILKKIWSNNLHDHNSELPIKRPKDYKVNRESLQVVDMLETSLIETSLSLINFDLLDSLDMVISHGDLNCGNILLRNHEVSFVDFEFSRITFFSWDVSSFISQNFNFKNIKLIYQYATKISRFNHEIITSSIIFFLLNDIYYLFRMGNFDRLNTQLTKLKSFLNYQQLSIEKNI